MRNNLGKGPSVGLVSETAVGGAHSEPKVRTKRGRTGRLNPDHFLLPPDLPLHLPLASIKTSFIPTGYSMRLPSSFHTFFPPGVVDAPYHDSPATSLVPRSSSL